MSGFRLIGLSGILLIVSACATPISVSQADPEAIEAVQGILLEHGVGP